MAGPAGDGFPSAAELLAGARLARSDAPGAERAIREALARLPADPEIRLGAYRFYFYNGRLAEALPHAEFMLSHAARRLNIATDWRGVAPGDATFGDMEAEPGLYIQALIAWGYCRVRLGEVAEGRVALAKAVTLDPRDRFGVRRILAVIDAAGQGDDV